MYRYLVNGYIYLGEAINESKHIMLPNDFIPVAAVFLLLDVVDVFGSAAATAAGALTTNPPPQ